MPSRRPSARSWRKTCQLVAPNAKRMENSRTRRGGPHQQQAGNIDHRHRHHQEHHAHHDQQRRAHLAAIGREALGTGVQIQMGAGDELFSRLGRLVALESGILLCGASPTARSGWRTRAAGFVRAQAANDVQPIRAVVVQVAPLRLNDRLHGDRHVEIGALAPNHTVEARRRDSGDGERVAIDKQRLAGNRRLREMGSPVIEGEHSDRVGIWSRFVTRKQQPARSSLHAERREVVATHHLNGDLLGLVVPGNAGRSRRSGDESAEDVVVVAQIPVHGIREVMVVAGTVSAFRVCMSFSAAGEAEHDELARIIDRKSAQQCLVEQGKDGGIRADGKSEGDDSSDGKARRAQDLAQGETKIT